MDITEVQLLKINPQQVLVIKLGSLPDQFEIEVIGHLMEKIGIDRYMVVGPDVEMFIVEEEHSDLPT